MPTSRSIAEGAGTGERPQFRIGRRSIRAEPRSPGRRAGQPRPRSVGLAGPVALGALMGREYWHGSPRLDGSKRLAAGLARSRAAPQGSAWVCRLVASRWTLAGSADYPVCRRKAARRAAFFRLPARAEAGTRVQPSRADHLRESRVSRRVLDAPPSRDGSAHYAPSDPEAKLAPPDSQNRQLVAARAGRPDPDSKRARRILGVFDRNRRGGNRLWIVALGTWRKWDCRQNRLGRHCVMLVPFQWARRRRERIVKSHRSNDQTVAILQNMRGRRMLANLD